MRLSRTQSTTPYLTSRRAFQHPRYYTCLLVLHPRGTARSPTFTHLPYGATPRPTTPDVPKQPCPFSAAQILLDGYSRPPATSTTITRLNSFTLADCGSAPPLITLDPCRHLHKPKPRCGCGGSPLTRRDSNPLSNVHLVAHRIFAASGGAFLKGTFNFDVLQCPRCSGPMQLIEAVRSEDRIRDTLITIGVSPRLPFIAPARLPGLFGVDEFVDGNSDMYSQWPVLVI